MQHFTPNPEPGTQVPPNQKGNPGMSTTTNQAPAPSTKRKAHLFWLMWLAGVLLLVDAIRSVLQTMSQASAVPFSDWVK